MKQLLLIVCLALGFTTYAEYPAIAVKHLPLYAPASEVANFNEYVLSHYPGYKLVGTETPQRAPYITIYYYTNASNDSMNIYYNLANDKINSFSINAPKENPATLLRLFFDNDNVVIPANGKRFLYDGHRCEVWYKKGATFIQFN